MFRGKKKPDPVQELEGHPAAQVAMGGPLNEFADLVTGHRVASQRMFLVAVMALLVAAGTGVGMYHIATTRQVERLIVEVTPNDGVRGKPVRINEMKPSDAVLKAELAKWAEKVMAIDSKRSGDWLQEANVMATGKALEQFRSWRETEGIATKIQKEPDYIRTAKVTSVDVATPGVAQVWVVTKESRGNMAPASPVQYRIRLDYSLAPPKTEQEVFDNPLGLYITFFEPTKQRI